MKVGQVIHKGANARCREKPRCFNAAYGAAFQRLICDTAAFNTVRQISAVW